MPIPIEGEIGSASIAKPSIADTLKRKLAEVLYGKPTDNKNHLRKNQSSYFGVLLALMVQTNELTEEDVEKVMPHLIRGGIIEGPMKYSYSFCMDKNWGIPFADPRFTEEAIAHFWPQFPDIPPGQEKDS